MSNKRDEARAIAGKVLTNVSIYPKAAQAALLGRDLSEVIDAVADAILASQSAAWASGYWHGTSRTGPLNDAAVDALNPYTDAA